MSTPRNIESLSVEEYLTGELDSEMKCEYVDGRVYAMADRKNSHHRVASRALGAIANQLGGSDCEAFNSDAKVRVQIQSRTYFYYPDVMVVCDPNDDEDTFHDRPVLIVEVVSESTRRVDEGEKADRYLSIPSLQAYLLVEQDAVAARAFIRDSTGNFVETVYQEPESVIVVESLGIRLLMAEICCGSA